MRPGQNKRMRGRNNSNNNRKGPNPLTRSYESNGPDVKIRGTAHHVGEKYLQLARDAHSAGDPVRAESYLQHAEHYFRVIAAAQQAQNGYGQQSVDLDDDDEGDDSSLPDRFASPSERPSQLSLGDRPPFQPQQGQGYQGQGHQGQNQQGYHGNGGERGGQPTGQGERNYDNRNGRNYDNRSAQDRGFQDRNVQDRNVQDRQQDRQQDRGYQGNGHAAAGQGHPGQGHSGQGYGQDRGYRGDGDRGGQQERQPQDRQPRNEQVRHEQPRHDQATREQPRDFDNRPRGLRPPRPVAESRQPAADEPVNGLPAFITAPTRVAAAEQSVPHPEAVEQAAAPTDAGEETVHLRPRRRRRSKAEFADKGDIAGDAEGSHEPRPAAPTTSDPVGD